MTNLTLEQFENGIQLYQDENLYKFTSDSIKLAKFCKVKHNDNVLDMCAGSGVVGLYLYSLVNCNKIYFNEIQPQMCELIKKNIKLNKINSKTKILCKNLSDLTCNDFEKPLDVVVCNPPYFKVNGKINQDQNVAICRHEIATNLGEIISITSKIIKSKGRFYLVLPASRLFECAKLLNDNRFEIKRVELYNSNGNATVCLIESVKNGNSGVTIKILKENL